MAERQWTKLESGISANLVSVWGSSAKDIYAVGDGGVILHSSDGKTWQKQNSGTTSPLNSVFGTGASDVYVVGYGKTILHTSDGGKTWTPQKNIRNSNGDLLVPGVQDQPDILSGVWASGVNDVYVAGSAGKMLHSVDRGATWVVQTVENEVESFSGVWGPSANEVYAVGTHFALIRSTDHGEHWEKFGVDSNGNPLVNNDLGTVWGSSAINVYFVGFEAIFKTTNGGDNIDLVPTKLGTGRSYDHYGVWGSGQNDVYVVGGPYSIEHFDGTKWELQELPFAVDRSDPENYQPALYTVWGPNAADVYVVGEGGLILHK